MASDQEAEMVSVRSSAEEVEGRGCELQRQVDGGEGGEERDGGIGGVDMGLCFFCVWSFEALFLKKGGAVGFEGGDGGGGGLF